MAEAIFTYEQQIIKIQCNKNQKMKEICKFLSTKIKEDINSLIFLGQGIQINLEKTFNEITKENKLSILVYKTDIEICPKCGRIINNKMIDDIISMINNVNYSLIGIKRQIELVMNDILNKSDINFINNQLNNINLIVNNISENTKKINNELNQIKFNGDEIVERNNNNHKYFIKNSNTIKQNNNNNYKVESQKNEITCIYNKQDDKINLFYDFNEDIEDWGEELKKKYIEGKNNINEKNIDIYINDKKIRFNCKYKSSEKGSIKVKFIFNKLLTSTSHMFDGCSSLKSIDLSSFNSINVKDMLCMFYRCSSVQLIDFSSFNTTNVRDMSWMFNRCSSLKSIDLSSFNTTKVNNFAYMFWGCSSLKSIDLSSFNTINVNNMTCMFCGCSSLKSINLSSFNTTNVNNMSFMFHGCSSLKKENVKFKNSDKKLLNEINKY